MKRMLDQKTINKLKELLFFEVVANAGKVVGIGQDGQFVPVEASGGTQLYKHSIPFAGGLVYIYVISDRSSAYTNFAELNGDIMRGFNPSLCMYQGGYCSLYKLVLGSKVVRVMGGPTTTYALYSTKGIADLTSGEITVSYDQKILDLDTAGEYTPVEL